jgi:hypothetical protein
MRVRKTEWTAADGRRLASARRQRNHTQEQCAAHLVRLGAPSATQGSVSNWEVARTGPTSDDTRAAIAEYCEFGDEQRGGRPSEAGAKPSVVDTTSGEFDDLVAQLVGSRPLSDRQARLIDAVLTRLEKGPPLSPDDAAALRLVAGVLGLSPR